MNENEKAQPDLVPAEKVVSQGSTIGEHLRTGRKALGLKAQQVAQELNLSRDTIIALEDDNYADLPGTTFVKGYLRSYARLLGEDIDDALELIDLGPEDKSEMPLPRAMLRKRGYTTSRKPKRRKGKGKIVILLIVIGLIIWVLNSPTLDKDLDQLSDRFKALLSLPGSEQVENDQPVMEAVEQPRNALIRLE